MGVKTKTLGFAHPLFGGQEFSLRENAPTARRVSSRFTKSGAKTLIEQNALARFCYRQSKLRSNFLEIKNVAFLDKLQI